MNFIYSFLIVLVITFSSIDNSFSEENKHETTSAEISGTSEASIYIEPKKALVFLTVEKVKDQVKGFNELYLTLSEYQEKLKTLKNISKVSLVSDKIITEGANEASNIKKNSQVKIIRKLRLELSDIKKIGEVLDSIYLTLPFSEVSSVKLILDESPDFEPVYKLLSTQLITKLRASAKSIGKELDEKNLVINFSEEPSNSDIREQLAENPTSSLDSGGKEIKIVGQIRGKLLNK